MNSRDLLGDFLIFAGLICVMLRLFGRLRPKRREPAPGTSFFDRPVLANLTGGECWLIVLLAFCAAFGPSLASFI